MDRLYVADNLKAENQNDLDSIPAQFSIIPHSEKSRFCKKSEKGRFRGKIEPFLAKKGAKYGVCSY
jgi:hypothetical protein